ncbi:MAG: SIR2 family protein [Rhodobacteraceae bacterium]|nr:SIR2 family protein [Paracoccaceae bacterium]
MRFHADGPAIPDILLERSDAGRVVFLCGAGVSLSSGMPDFVGLTKHVIDFLEPPEDSDIMAAFKPWLHNQPGPKVPLDQIFNLLHQEYGRNDVNVLVTERLTEGQRAREFAREHDLIKRISFSRSGVPQIVTTNFDRLFETDVPDTMVKLHVPPALPDLAHGASIEGITYLHGRIAEADAVEHRYVLSSADLGRAYLSEAWATKFIRNLLGRYTVVLVGYQAEDSPIKYLLQGLNEDGERNRSRLYVIDKGMPEEIEAKWRDRGATAIAYADHPQLWHTMEAWAERADDPRGWRASVISTTKRDPKSIAAHERGQVAHVLRTVQGAKLLSQAGSAVHPEWICVLDADVRSAELYSGAADGNRSFDPWLAYGLDDDRRRDPGNDNLLVWRPGDDNPHEFHRLGGRQADGSIESPARLGYLITWIMESVHSPVLAWWAIRQNSLHPCQLHRIDHEILYNKNLPRNARHVWNLILEHQRDLRNHLWLDDSWFHLKNRIDAEGWSNSVIRDFRQASRPRVKIRPLVGLGNVKPPTAGWSGIQLRNLGRVELKFLETQINDLEIPDTALPQVFKIMEDQLAVASGLLADVDQRYFTTPTCYPNREVNGEMRHSEAAEFMTQFIELFERLVELRPELGRAHAITWSESDRFYFRKLKLFGLSKERIFEADQVLQTVLSFDQEAFWDSEIARELLFLLVDRWKEFSLEGRAQLAERILKGPEQPDHCPDEKFPRLRNVYAARYGKYLELEGCALPKDHELRLAKIINEIPQWHDSWATATVTAWGVHVGWVGINTAPDVLTNLPMNEVVAKAMEVSDTKFGDFTEMQPFKGLVKRSPQRALTALTSAGKTGDHPTELWSAMIDELPEDASPRLKQQFLRRIARLPQDVIVELRHPLGRWLNGQLASAIELDENLAWSVYDHVVDNILSGCEEAGSSSRGDVLLNGKVVHQSRRTLDHAINAPLGMCTEALFKAVPGEAHEAGSLIPDHVKARLERLLSASGEGADHAVSVTASKLNWIMQVDPEWTKERLFPMLDFNNPASEPAWNGFLHSREPPLPALAALVKPLLLNLHPWIDRFTWGDELSEVAGEWLGSMRIFRPDQPDGLTKKEMRSALRSMSDDTRCRFILWLGLVGGDNDDGWANLVVPFVDTVWPRELMFRTSSSARAWLRLLENTGDSFPAVYPAVKKFLAPVEPNGYPFYRLTRGTDDGESITTRFPEAMLDLMNTVTPVVVQHLPYKLPEILEMISESDESLTSDPRYLRLIDLVERS